MYCRIISGGPRAHLLKQTHKQFAKYIIFDTIVHVLSLIANVHFAETQSEHKMLTSKKGPILKVGCLFKKKKKEN